MGQKEDIEQLIQSGMGLAQHLLQTLGEFFPFGTCLGNDDEVRFATAFDQASQKPPTEEVLKKIEDGFIQTAEAGEIRAVAIFTDVRVQRPGDAEKADAVQIGVEHREGHCVNVIVPYTVNDGGVNFVDSFTVSRVGIVFLNKQN